MQVDNYQHQELNKLKEKLTEITHKYENLLGRFGFRMVYPSGEITFVNPSICELSGFSEKEWKEQKHFFRKIIHPEFMEFYGKIFFKQPEETIQKIELIIITKNGKENWWLLIPFKEFDSRGKLIAFNV